MKPFHWRPLARYDANTVSAWYASQGGLALELAFIEELEATLELIAQNPGAGSSRHASMFPELPTPLRFFALHRFDRYLVYYMELTTHLEIVRVWDTARDIPTRVEEAKPDPQAWQRGTNE